MSSVHKRTVSLRWETGLPGLNQYLRQRKNCLAQEHNAVSTVRLDPATPRSRAKHLPLSHRAPQKIIQNYPARKEIKLKGQEVYKKVPLNLALFLQYVDQLTTTGTIMLQYRLVQLDV